MSTFLLAVHHREHFFTFVLLLKLFNLSRPPLKRVMSTLIFSFLSFFSSVHEKGPNNEVWDTVYGGWEEDIKKPGWDKVGKEGKEKGNVVLYPPLFS
jgi:hypothetical protein